MSYNKQNYRRIREEYSTKYLKDREAADLRREEVHAAIPETEELDRQLKGWVILLIIILNRQQDI